MTTFDVLTYPAFTGYVAKKWLQNARSSESLSKGRVAWNALYELRPDLCRKIMDSWNKDIDPFNDDSRIPAFMEFVEENW